MFFRTVALLTRSFRVDARSAQSHFIRLLFALMILASLLWNHTMLGVVSAPGLAVFSTICWLNFVFITLAGVGLFATAISEEKDEDTLGLLRMAGIGPAALLLGKSTTRVVSVLLMLAVQFPFVLLSITLGGVTLTQVFAAAVALVAYLFFVANLGLMFSVYGSNSRRASTLTTIALVFLHVMLPILAWSAPWLRRGTFWISEILLDAALWMNSISIMTRIWAILSSGFSESAVSQQVVVHFLAAIALFGLSWATFERFTRARDAARPLELALVKPFRRMKRNRSSRAWLSPLALAWKDFHFVAGGKTMVVARFFVYLAIISAVSVFLIRINPALGGPKLREIVGGTAMVTMLGAAAVELSLFAARVFREEVRAQALPLLVMLPTTTAQLAWSKASAAFPALLPTVACFLLGAVVNPDGFFEAAKEVLSHAPSWFVVVWFVFFLHLAAYLSLVVKWGALPLAIFVVYLLQMILWPIMYLLWLVLSSGGRPAPPSEFVTVGPLMLVGVIGTVVLEFRISSRLEYLAGR